MTSDTAIATRPTTIADIPAVVDLQSAFLEGSIVTELGKPFLSAFHRAAQSHPSTRAFVATDAAHRVVGMLSGSVDVHAFNGHVKPRVLLPLAAALLSPRGWRYGPMFARSLFEAEPKPHIPAELLLLVVDPAMRRQRIAQRLVWCLEESFAAHGIEQYRVAVRSQLAIARAFYEATGFQTEQELTVLGAPMTYLTKRVSR